MGGGAYLYLRGPLLSILYYDWPQSYPSDGKPSLWHSGHDDGEKVRAIHRFENWRWVRVGLDG